VPGKTPSSEDFRRLLASFDPIGLAQMDAVALLDRTDTKVVLQTTQLYTALSALHTDYWVLDIDGVRGHPYQTLYFDTADFALYLRHHAGRQLRYKVRSRQYVDSHRAFLEVKVKTTKDRTSKKRIETDGLVTELTPEASGFVDAALPLDAQLLKPNNQYLRIHGGAIVVDAGDDGLDVNGAVEMTGGLVQDGSYTPGEEIASFTISDIVTVVGNSYRR
jgi:hypothetical protein